MRRGSLPTETFVLGSNQCKSLFFFFFCLESVVLCVVLIIWLENFVDIITSVHENWFAARCLNTTQPAGEGAIVMQTAVYVLVALWVLFTCRFLLCFFFLILNQDFYCVFSLVGMMDRLVQLLELWLQLIILHRSWVEKTYSFIFCIESIKLWVCFEKYYEVRWMFFHSCLSHQFCSGNWDYANYHLRASDTPCN